MIRIVKEKNVAIILGQMMALFHEHQLLDISFKCYFIYIYIYIKHLTNYIAMALLACPFSFS